MRRVTLTWLVVFSVGVFADAGIAEAEDISGPIAFTRTIFEDSQLVGDVTCTTTTTPCLEFGAHGIKLSLNGFTMTGPAEPPANCSSSLLMALPV